LIVTSLLLLIPLLLRRYRRLRNLSRPNAGSADDAEAGIGRRLMRRGRRSISELEHLIHEPGLLAFSVVLSLVYVLLNLGAAWMAFRALGGSPSIMSVFLAVSVGVTVGALSGTPGGGLTTEVAMVKCYELLGVETPIALAATLLYRGLHYLLVLVLGGPSLAVLELLHRRAEPEADSAPAS
jgi:uncharacterized protein (TIRG00374 family)